MTDTKTAEIETTEIIERPEAAPVVSQATALIQVIERAAMNPEVDIDKMERLMGMHERILAKQAEAEFNDAMSAAQAEMTRVAADANNPQTKSRYASYGALDKAIRPIYTKHGFNVTFNTGKSDKENYVLVLGMIGHNGGHTNHLQIDMPADGKGAKGGDVMTLTHAAGSALSYGRRYLLGLGFNIAVGEDNDGNGAGDPITDAQKKILVELQQEAGADTAQFLKFLKVESLDELPASRFNEARQALNSKVNSK